MPEIADFRYMDSPGVSVVVCAKNEAARIEACLASLAGQGAAEIIVVDGNSRDDTANIARRMGATVIVSTAGSLAADRNMGARFACGDVIAFVDADHRLPRFGLARLSAELDALGADVVQASLSIVPRSFWNRAESDLLAMTQHGPAVRDMIGTAPAVFRREVLAAVSFADVGGIDDTDYMYRLHRDTGFVTVVGRTVVAQEHEPRLRDYLRKFSWYGRGDGAFMREHPTRRMSMLRHLLIRYPIEYPVRALACGRWRAAPFAVIQGLARFAYSCRH